MMRSSRACALRVVVGAILVTAMSLVALSEGGDTRQKPKTQPQPDQADLPTKPMYREACERINQSTNLLGGGLENHVWSIRELIEESAKF